MKSRVLDLGGTFLAYKEAGSGPTTVLIPALDEGSFVYTLQLEGAAGIGRVIAVDNIGSAASDRPAIEYRPGNYLRLAARFLDKMAGEPSTLCAHGDAAALALALAISRAAKVAGIVLVNPDISAVLAMKGAAARKIGVLGQTPLARSLAGIRVSADLRARLRRISRAGKGKHEAFEYASLRDTALGAGFKTVGMRRREHAAEWSEWTSRMGEITAPVRVVLGRRFRSRCRASVDVLRRELPGIEVVELEGAGRYPMIEAPEEFMVCLQGIGCPRMENKT